MEYKGYTIVESERHGKAVKGTKKTTSIQVREPMGNGYLLKKQISYPIHDYDKKQKAIEKAKKYVDEQVSGGKF